MYRRLRDGGRVLMGLVRMCLTVNRLSTLVASPALCLSGWQVPRTQPILFTQRGAEEVDRIIVKGVVQVPIRTSEYLELDRSIHLSVTSA